MKTKTSIPSIAAAVISLLAVDSAEAAITLNGGWQDDQIAASNVDSNNSPYVFSYTFPVQLSLTDAFLVGDTFFVYDFGSLILTTSVSAGAPFSPSNAIADSAWEGGSYSIGSIMLAPGLHEITIQGDAFAGAPAGYYLRLDASVSAIPEPSNAAILGLLLGTGLLGRFRRTA